MQLEGGPWDNRILHGESLVHEKGLAPSCHHHPTATSHSGGGRLNPQDHQQDRAGTHAGEAAPCCVCRIPSHVAFGQAQLVKWLVHKTRYLETESGAACSS